MTSVRRLLRITAIVWIRTLYRFRLGSIYAWLLEAVIREISLNGKKISPDKRGGRQRLTLFVLHQDLFRGDLEMLAEHRDVQILTFNVIWQQLLVDAFYRRGISAYDWYRTEDQIQIKQQRHLRKFLLPVLKQIFKMYQVDALVSPNVRYVEDLDWSYTSKQIGIPSIVLFREGLLMFERAYRGTMLRHKEYGTFHGTHILVHNQVSRNMFIESGFASEEQISVIGVPRMDKLCRKIKAQRTAIQAKTNVVQRQNNKKVLLLYYSPGKYQEGFVDDGGLWRPPGVPQGLFETSIKSLLELVQDNSTIELLIKPKKGDQSIRYLYELVKKLGIDITALSNLQINDSVDLHDAIFESKVVCGLQTTAILEACLAGKQVVLPYFVDYRDSEWSMRFGYRKYLDAFTVADDSESFKTAIVEGVASNAISERMNNLRRSIFSDWVSDPEGGATALCLESVRRIVKQAASDSAS